MIRGQQGNSSPQQERGARSLASTRAGSCSAPWAPNLAPQSVLFFEVQYLYIFPALYCCSKRCGFRSPPAISSHTFKIVLYLLRAATTEPPQFPEGVTHKLHCARQLPEPPRRPGGVTRELYFLCAAIPRTIPMPRRRCARMLFSARGNYLNHPHAQKALHVNFTARGDYLNHLNA